MAATMQRGSPVQAVDSVGRSDRPSNLTQIGFKSSIFQPVWPWNLMDDPKKKIGYLFYATLSFLHHFVAIGEFKLELQSGIA